MVAEALPIRNAVQTCIDKVCTGLCTASAGIEKTSVDYHLGVKRRRSSVFHIVEMFSHIVENLKSLPICTKSSSTMWKFASNGLTELPPSPYRDMAAKGP